jgi:hypothetical protein
MGREAMEAHPRQDRQFCQVDNPVRISEKDDDLVAIFFLQPQAPASGALSPQPRSAQTGTGIRLLRW